MTVDLRRTALLHTNGRLGFLLSKSAPCVRPPAPDVTDLGPPAPDDVSAKYSGLPAPNDVRVDGDSNPCGCRGACELS